MKIYTKAIQFKADGKLYDRIDQKLSKMERLFDRIIDASVNLKLENSGQVKDKILEVKMNVPGSTLIASATDKTFESALDTVVDSLKKQLIKYKAKLQKGS
ncbi:MAG: ribosome-associated translation inhibitor RaiA [Saprospiraceae bacterium]